jgi:hypothetical protein
MKSSGRKILCLLLLYNVLSLFIQGIYSKTQGFEFDSEGRQWDNNFLRGSPIMTLSLFSPMSYGIWGLEKEDNNPYEFPVEKIYTFKRESHLLESWSVLLWHPRDDERYMHSLDFPPQVTKHKTQTCCRLSYVWRWAHGHDTYCILGDNDDNFGFG